MRDRGFIDYRPEFTARRQRSRSDGADSRNSAASLGADLKWRPRADWVLDATLKMWRYASIAGRLVDESGDAAVGASLNLVRVTLARGRRQLASSGSATTDDRGQYRFGTLLPGSYLVQVRSNVMSLPPSVIQAYQRAVASGTST